MAIYNGKCPYKTKAPLSGALAKIFVVLATSFEQAKNFHQIEAYSLIGMIYSKPKYGILNKTKSRELFEKGCLLGDRDSCYYLYEFNPQQALKGLENLCDTNDGWACYALGELLGDSDDRKLIVWTKACELQIGSACAYVSATLSKKGLLTESYKYAKNGCDLNDAPSCHNTSAVLEALTTNPIGQYASELDRNKILLQQLPYLQKAYELDNTRVQALGETYQDLKKYEMSLPLFKKGCYQLKNPQSCLSLATHYEFGFATELNLAKAELLYKRTCDAANGDCSGYIDFLVRNKEGSDEEIIQLRKKGCAEGNRNSCFKLGMHFWENRNFSNDQNARDYFKRACDLNFSLGCTMLAEVLQSLDPSSRIESLKLLSKACDLGFGGACVKVGWAYNDGDGYKKNDNLAAMFMEKACNLNEPGGCYFLADFQKAKGNLTQAEHLVAKGCDLDPSHHSCVLYASLTANKGSEHYPKAVEILNRTCLKNNNYYACQHLGFLYQFGLMGLNVDFEKMEFFYDLACEGNDASGCRSLLLKKRTSPLTADSTSLLNLAEKACNLGDDAACNENAKILVETGNLEKGLTILDNLCSKGDISSCTSYGRYTLFKSVSHSDVIKGITYLEEASRVGDEEASMWLALTYSLGSKVPKDKRKSMDYLLRLKSRSPEVLFMIANVYFLNGMEVESSFHLKQMCGVRSGQLNSHLRTICKRMGMDTSLN